ncbi:SPOSA6832_02077, partial [Sporobolomyces salmonicolor]
MRAVELTKSHPAHTPTRVHVFQHDLTAPPSRPSLTSQLLAVPPEFGEPVQQFDIVSSIFVLSALAPRNHAKAVQTLISGTRAQLLAPGGSLLFRDYALHDEAQLRFHALPSASYATVPSLLSPQTASPATSSSPSLDEDTASFELNKPWYKRGDQTMTYFFTPAELQTLVDAACTELGVTVEGGVGVVERKMENRGEGWACTRRFVHGSWKRVA